MKTLIAQIEKFAQKGEVAQAYRSYQFGLQYALKRLRQRKPLLSEEAEALLKRTVSFGKWLKKEKRAAEVLGHYELALHLAEDSKLCNLSGDISYALSKFKKTAVAPVAVTNLSAARPLAAYRFNNALNSYCHYQAAHNTEGIMQAKQKVTKLMAKLSYRVLYPLLFVEIAKAAAQPSIAVFEQTAKARAGLAKELADAKQTREAQALLEEILGKAKGAALAIDLAPLLEGWERVNEHLLDERKYFSLPPQWLQYRERLWAIRRDHDEWLDKQLNEEGVAAAQEKLIIAIHGLLKEMLQGIERMLREAPAPICIMIMGSMARGDALPFSDLEPLVLIGDDSPAATRYAQSFVKLWEINITSLGESDPKRPGLHLDAPYVLNDEDHSFLNTPEKLIGEWYPVGQLLDDNTLRDGSHYSPLYAQYLYGDEALAQRYCALLQARLDQAAGPNENCSLRHFLALKQLAYDGEQYEKLCEDLLEEKVDLKARFAKPIINALQALCLYHNISARSPAKMLEALKARIGLACADSLLLAHTATQRLRWRWHMRAQCQQDKGKHSPEETLCETRLPDNRLEFYSLARIEREILRPFYRQLAPFIWQAENVPSREGLRLSSQRAALAWLRTLENLAQAEAPTTGLAVLLEWVQLIVGENGAIAHAFKKGHLRPEVAVQFLSPDSKAFRTAKGLYSHANHPVHRTVFRGEDVHIKFYPELPALEASIYHLCQLVVGHGSQPVTLAKMTFQGQSEPVLLSQTVEGVALNEVARHPELLQRLCPTAFAEQALMTLLTNPEDSKPDNYRLQPFFDCDGHWRYRLVGVDNDHAFNEPLVKNFLGKTHLQVKSIVYCLDAMKQPLPPRVIEGLSKLDPYAVLSHWLRLLEELDEAHWELFGKDLIQACLRRSLLQKTTVPLLLESAIVKELYEKLCRLQRHLAHHAQQEEVLAPIELLNLIEPQLGLRYAPMLEQALSPWERFNDLTQHAYSLILQDYPNYADIHRSGLRQVPNKQDVLKREKYRAKGCLALLKEEVHAKMHHLADCRRALEQGDSGPFKKTEFAYFRELVLNQVRFEHIVLKKGRPDIAKQTTILVAIAGTPFRVLHLRHCAALTAESLFAILAHCPELVELDLSGCHALDPGSYYAYLTQRNFFDELAAHCPQLDRLYLSDCPSIAEIKTQRPLKLTKLAARHCPSLQEIALNAPLLQEVDASGCPVLSTINLSASAQLATLSAKGCTSLAQITVDSDHWQRAALVGCKQLKADVSVLERFPILLNYYGQAELVFFQKTLEHGFKNSGHCWQELALTLRQQIHRLMDINEHRNIKNFLLQALQDKKTSTHTDAAQALGNLKSADPDILIGLYAALRHEEWEVRYAVTKVFIELGTIYDEIATTLSNAVQNKNEHKDVRHAAINILVKLRASDPRTLSALCILIREKNADRFYVTMSFMSGVGVPNGIPYRGVHDEISDLRLAAAEALGDLSADHPEIALKTLHAALQKETHWSACRAMTQSFIKLSGKIDPDWVTNWRNILLDKNEDALSHRIAIEALSDFKATDLETLNALRAILRNDEVDTSISAIFKKMGYSILTYVSLGEHSRFLPDEIDVRSAAAQALGELKSTDPETLKTLRTALKDTFWKVRGAAAEALGKIEANDSETIHALRDALKDQHDAVRDRARAALVKLYSYSAENNFYKPLCTALQDKWNKIRHTAAEALSNLKAVDPEILHALHSALKDEEPYIRHATAKALGNLKINDPETINALRGVLRDNAIDVRRAAAEALLKLDTSGIEALAVLRSALKDNNIDIDIRHATVEALLKLDPADTDTLAVLRSALKDKDIDIRHTAAQTLLKSNPADTNALAVLCNVLKDKEIDIDIRHAAVKALLKLDPADTDALAVLRGALKDNHIDIRHAAAEALLKSDPADIDALAVLHGALKDKDIDIRHTAAEALLKSDPANIDALAVLRGALKDNHIDIRHAAAEALLKSDPTNTDALAVLRGALKDKDINVYRAAAAAKALSRVFSLGAMAAFIQKNLQKAPIAPAIFTFTQLQTAVTSVVVHQLEASAERQHGHVAEDEAEAIAQYVTTIHRHYFDFSAGFWRSPRPAPATPAFLALAAPAAAAQTSTATENATSSVFTN